MSLEYQWFANVDTGGAMSERDERVIDLCFYANGEWHVLDEDDPARGRALSAELAELREALGQIQRRTRPTEDVHKIARAALRLLPEEKESVPASCTCSPGVISAECPWHD